MVRGTERLDPRGRRAFGVRDRAWPLSGSRLQSVFDRARWRRVAVRTDGARLQGSIGRRGIAAGQIVLYQRPRLLTHFWDSQIGETLTRCLFTKEERHR